MDKNEAARSFLEEAFFKEENDISVSKIDESLNVLQEGQNIAPMGASSSLDYFYEKNHIQKSTHIHANNLLKWLIPLCGAFCTCFVLFLSSFSLRDSKTTETAECPEEADYNFIASINEYENGEALLTLPVFSEDIAIDSYFIYKSSSIKSNGTTQENAPAQEQYYADGMSIKSSIFFSSAVTSGTEVNENINLFVRDYSKGVIPKAEGKAPYYLIFYVKETEYIIPLDEEQYLEITNLNQ